MLYLFAALCLLAPPSNDETPFPTTCNLVILCEAGSNVQVDGRSHKPRGGRVELTLTVDSSSRSIKIQVCDGQTCQVVHVPVSPGTTVQVDMRTRREALRRHRFRPDVNVLLVLTNLGS